MKVLEYRIVSGATPAAFQAEVNQALQDGWELLGPCAVAGVDRQAPTGGSAGGYVQYVQTLTRGQ